MLNVPSAGWPPAQDMAGQDQELCNFVTIKTSVARFVVRMKGSAAQLFNGIPLRTHSALQLNSHLQLCCPC